ncbi:unnamed protein product, partial [Sphagnum compactum]
MALGDFVLCRQRSLESIAGGTLGPAQLLPSIPQQLMDDHLTGTGRVEEEEEAQHAAEEQRRWGGGGGVEAAASVPHFPHNLYLSDLRHDAGEPVTLAGPLESGVVSKWRMKDRMKTGCVALVLCLNVGVDPPDVIKISPCARMECWIDPFSPTSQKALKPVEAVGKNLIAQYERWQPKAKYKVQTDPTVEDVKKLCLHCRKTAKSERVLFHYNGHGVPRPTANGEIWLFNKSFTQYIPLSVYELESWLGNPSIYVFDCSAAGMIVNAFCERPDWGLGGTMAAPAMRDCILLAACGAHEILPQNADLPADIFTSCLTTPIKIALRWFCPRSLLPLDADLIDKIPGRQTDRKTPLGELNWIFTAITDTIAWNVLPRELFQRLFRQDLLVASLFRNFLLAERIMRAANCSPLSYPRLPPTHQHPMWHAWDMAAEICLAQLPMLLHDPKAEFQPSPFFTEQLTAFEIWLEHGSEKKKPPEQLPIVLQVLLSHSHRFRALVLLGRFLDMGAWAVDLALSVGIFPYVLKLLQTTATDLRQILVFIWTKILALDKSCQVDLVKDGGHQYFIKFLESPDNIHPEQRAMAAFVLAVIVDEHQPGQLACIQGGLVGICLMHIQAAPSGSEGQPEPLLIQWLCLCLGKLWDGVSDGVTLALQDNAPSILGHLLSEPQPEVRAAATYALGTLVTVAAESSADNTASEDDVDEYVQAAEQEIGRYLLRVLSDGSPLVRAELATAMARLAASHNRMFRQAAAAYLKPPSHCSVLPPFGPNQRSASFPYSTQFVYAGKSIDSELGVQVFDGAKPFWPAIRILPSGASLHSADSSPLSDTPLHGESPGSSNGVMRSWKRTEDGNIYVQCITAVYALARDPSPRVASLGRQVLRIVGVEAQVVKPSRASGLPTHQRNASVPAIPPTPPNPGVLHRSTSWVASASGNLASTWRISTPPPSPPTRPTYLTGTAGSLRRVASMELSSASIATWDSSKQPVRISGDIGIQSLSAIPRVSNMPGGLAEAAGMLTYGLSTLNLDSPVASVAATVLPQSTLYSWSCGHFSRPLLEASHDEEEEIIARREEREHLAQDGIAKCHQSRSSKVSEQIASWDTTSEMGTKALLLHPFKPLVCVADDKETIRLWNYEEGAEVVNTFDNHNAPDKGISKLCLVNELDDSLLLVASSDGVVRVWRDYAEKDNQRLATAWQTVQGHRPGVRSINAVVDWQQMTGYLYASGEISWIMVWDLDQEQLASSIPSQSESGVSALAASQKLQSAHFLAGCGDGSVRVFDIRSRDMLVCEMKPHAQKVVGLDFLAGPDHFKIVSASPAGDLKFLDLRNSSGPYQGVDAHKGHLTSIAVHRHAQVIATGSSKQVIKTFSANGEQLGMVRFHNSFLGQRIGPVSALNFHLYSILLAAGATDSIVSVY